MLPIIDWLDLFASPLLEQWEMLPIDGRSDSLGSIKTCSPVEKELLLRGERPSSSKTSRLVSFMLKNHQFKKSLLPLTETETFGQNHQQNNYTNTEDKIYLFLAGFLCPATRVFYIEN